MAPERAEPAGRKLGEILLDAGVIDEFQLRSALGEQQRWGGRLGITLIKLGFLEERDLVRALASQMGLPVARLEGKRIEPGVLDLVPAELAERCMCLPLFVRDEPGGRTLYVGMEDPSDLAALDDLRFRTGALVKPVLMGPSELCEGIDRFYRGRGAPTEAGPPGVEPARPATEPPQEPAPEALAAPPRSPAPPREASQPASRPAPGDAPTRVILRALTEVLVEKGLLTREELMERVQRLQEPTRT